MNNINNKDDDNNKNNIWSSKYQTAYLKNEYNNNIVQNKILIPESE
jgi:hypothetical protein